MKIVKMFFDLETTGVNPKRHSVHQIAGLIEIDGTVVEEFDIRTRPHPKAEITAEALSTCNVTEEEILAYDDMKVAYRKLINILERYIDKYNPKQKAYLVGYNNRFFDDVFLRRWFEQNGDNYFGSWFWNDTLDTLVLASQYLIGRRPSMPSFKLKRVALELGIEVDKTKLHDAYYDIYLTRQIYQIVTGLEIE